MPPNDFEALAKNAFDSIKCTLGVEVIYRPKVGGVITIRGVFDNRAQEVDPDTEQPVSSNLFTLGIKLDDIPAPPAKGDKVTIREKLYKVVDALEDGVPDASVVLVLHRIDS